MDVEALSYSWDDNLNFQIRTEVKSSLLIMK